jgi:hypothetical protein
MAPFIQLGSRWLKGFGNSARFLVGGNEECLKHQTQHYEDERLFLKPILPLAQNRQPATYLNNILKGQI